MNRIRSIISGNSARINTYIFPTENQHKLYTRYVGWSFVSNVIVSVENALATHSMLFSLGGISSAPDVQSAIRTYNYIGKDLVGQIGFLIYMTNSRHKIDKEPRKIIMYSNIAQQFAIFSNCVTPLFSGLFLPITSIASFLGNISFTGFGAINAKCIQHISTDNMGEIYAKITAINTIGSSIGLLLGIGITIMVPNHATRLLFIPFLSFLRIYSFNRAVLGII